MYISCARQDVFKTFPKDEKERRFKDVLKTSAPTQMFPGLSLKNMNPV